MTRQQVLNEVVRIAYSTKYATLEQAVKIANAMPHKCCVVVERRPAGDYAFVIWRDCNEHAVYCTW